MTATVLLYTVYGLAAVLVLGIAAVLLTLILGALRVLWRWARRTDVYEPAASDPVERQYASVGDTFGFKSDPDGPLFAAQVESMLRRAGEGVDVYRDAPKEPS